MNELKLEKENKLQKAKESVIKVIDENGNGEIDIEDIIIKGLKIPGIKINRDDFLRKELVRKYPKDVIELAVTTSPMKAGIDSDDIDKIAKDIIQFERVCVSGISAALGVPGGAAMAASIPADIIQYYAYLLRATQKLLYLHGFPSLMSDDEDNKIDTEIMNILILCMGVMYGVAGAKNGLLAVAKAFGIGLEKKLIKAALTKGAIYPMVKKTMAWFGVSLTKQIYAGFFKKAIPVVAGAVGGTITYLSFKPCCDKLNSTLKDSILSNPKYKDNNEESIIIFEVLEDEE
jgi:hypothetical protein